MNLELIRKYEKEFLHMLHGGNILVKCTDQDNVSHKEYLDWHCDSDVFESNLDYLIVIEDKYVEFRKASAEGKTIEELYYTPTEHWGKHLSGFAISPKMLRIKPKEPEFIDISIKG